MAAREGDAASKRMEEQDSSLEAADQKADMTVPGAAPADVDECSDDEEDPVIRNLNVMSWRNLMTPEWIENRKKMHYEEIALYNRVYDALQNGEIETDPDDDDDDDGSAAAERTKSLWEGVDLSGLNKGGESRGVYAVAVYPEGLNPEEEQGHDATAATESSS